MHNIVKCVRVLVDKPDRGVWRIFEHPAECHDVIRQVVVSGGK